MLYRGRGLAFRFLAYLKRLPASVLPKPRRFTTALSINRNDISQKLILPAAVPIESLNDRAKRFSGACDLPNICTLITQRCTQYRWINISASVSRGLSHLLTQTLSVWSGFIFQMDQTRGSFVRSCELACSHGRRRKRKKTRKRERMAEMLYYAAG